MNVDVKSALVGAAAVMLFGLAASWQSASGVTPLTRVEKPPIPIVGIPDPREIIVIEEGAPYVVPNGTRFVATGIGTTHPGGQISPGAAIVVDGVPLAALSPHIAGFSFLALPTAIVAEAGMVVESDDFNSSVGTPRIYGYLVDA